MRRLRAAEVRARADAYAEKLEKRIAELTAELAALKADQLSWIMSQGQAAELEAAHERNANLVAELAEEIERRGVAEFRCAALAGGSAELQRELAVLKRALELACKDMHWTVAMPLPLWHLGRPAKVEEVVAYYKERAWKELADD